MSARSHRLAELGGIEVFPFGEGAGGLAVVSQCVLAVGGAGHEFGKYLEQFCAGVRVEHAEAERAGIKAFAGGAIGKDDLVCVEHQVDVEYLPFPLCDASACGCCRQMFGPHQLAVPDDKAVLLGHQ